HALMALAATAYLAKMGEAGLRGIADISYRRAHHLAARLTEIPGFSLKFPDRDFLWEFVLETPTEAGALARELAGEGILAGYPLGEFDVELTNCLLVCTTELTSPKAIDRLVSRLTQATVPSLAVEAVG
ncbi:MAG: glycine dehydrogenase, partial [Candidatus Dormiibacterota bacterium]